MALRLTVVSIGRGEPRWEAVASELCSLIRPYAEVELVGVRPPGRQDGSAAALAAEGEAARRRWPPGAHSVALSPEGAAMDSAAFARWLGKLRSAGRPVVFTIGGAWGLDPALKGASSELLSLSALTLSHRVALLVLLEQIYRGFTILSGHPYHK